MYISLEDFFHFIKFVFYSPVIAAFIASIFVMYGWYKTKALELKTFYLQNTFLTFAKLKTEYESTGKYSDNLISEIDKALKMTHLFGSQNLVKKVNKLSEDLTKDTTIEVDPILRLLRDELRKELQVGKINENDPIAWVVPK